jgi:hypothetical protein
MLLVRALIAVSIKRWAGPAFFSLFFKRRPQAVFIKIPNLGSGVQSMQMDRQWERTTFYVAACPQINAATAANSESTPTNRT